MLYVGLDLGQRQDFSALAVVEREDLKFAWMPAPRELSVRHLERMELGTPYPKVVERVCEVMRHPNVVHQSRLVVDATGVGAPVVDLLRSAGLGVRLTTVTITGGERARGQGERWQCSSGGFAGGDRGDAGSRGVEDLQAAEGGRAAGSRAGGHAGGGRRGRA